MKHEPNSVSGVHNFLMNHISENKYANSCFTKFRSDSMSWYVAKSLFSKKCQLPAWQTGNSIRLVAHCFPKVPILSRTVSCFHFFRMWTFLDLNSLKTRTVAHNEFTVEFWSKIYNERYIRYLFGIRTLYFYRNRFCSMYDPHHASFWFGIEFRITGFRFLSFQEATWSIKVRAALTSDFQLARLKFEKVVL